MNQVLLQPHRRSDRFVAQRADRRERELTRRDLLRRRAVLARAM
jgi:hypothetical protein